MDIKTIKAKFKKSEGVQKTIQQLENRPKQLQWKNVIGASKAFHASATAEQVPGHHLFILEDKEKAAYFLNDLQNLYPDDDRVVFYPASYRVPYKLEEVDNANVVGRAEALDKITKSPNSWIVTYPKALFERVPTKQKLSTNTFKVEKGEEYELEFLNEFLLEHEFNIVDFVYEPGQFSIRGGIVDIFSYSNDQPFRLEFFGDELETIRTFDPVSQLSIKEHAFFHIVPNIQLSLDQAENGSFLSFVGNETTIWISSYKEIKGQLENEYKKAANIFNELPDTGVTHSKPSELYFHATEWEKEAPLFSQIEWGPDYTNKNADKIEFSDKPQPAFNKNFDLLTEDLKQRKNLGFTNLIFSNQPKQIERLIDIFKDIQADAEFTPIHSSIHEGFINEELKLVCYTDHQIFERYNRFRLKEGFRQAKQALTLKELHDLQKGDYVTHIDHGVGRFSGLETVDVNGKPQETIRLVYKDNDVLYVSIHSLHRISKFTGKDGTAPTMNKLGTQTWAKLKNKTKKKIKEIAFDLIQLYAKRKSQPGFAYAPDTYLQNELEASFIYEDTPDQLKATEAVKEDMEKDTPMDRLICGDVGFGKTEIAVRAAFKAATDGKQVAILVPTTILSLQHYRSFKERLKDFPVRVDYVNRFKTTKQTNETLKDLEEGKIDILIGTHKIVGKKVKFKDLGLIIIDEEQKFGVSVKDKLKTLKATVDTLTLTATPIPRTLQFSLMGARDLSIINTPPPNRQPVLTEVIEFDEEIIRDAISYEVSRGGQVYFVHNRLENIKEVSGMIQRLCPGVRVAIGHGQMDGKELEKIMMGFINHEYDVLLATTIIESGIDISNANTMIINNANNFGLSDLHQLRGRVGRSTKKGFCYLIAPRYNMLTSEAQKRLNALVQFSDLGAGFSIAMKDLDIRGAGNLLGGEQSGFIADIGFDMYQKILNEAIDELRQSEFKELFENRNTDDYQQFIQECVLETDLEIRIPDDYVNNVSERLSLYQELDSLQTEEELKAFEAQLKDRFGPIPKAVEDLFQSIRLRRKAQEVGFTRLIIKSEKMIGYFHENPEHLYYQSPIFTQVLNFVQTNPKGVKMNQKNEKLRLIFSDVKSVDDALEKVSNVMR
ncbi:transcription-repair coupling factor [Brumimicrobium salinarum]|uniref:Transcription-repair-coupling factor n=1 Tax=Brumimicrobium salinarum TaxID=2058658 RepID=A0A2I0R6C3_9FLAO|nr:transcription-repair coupling factor [Brumimicrobium salinarum]PKR82138.1 transcription-repair coupling factor [Brumimicrobium salinarum]